MPSRLRSRLAGAVRLVAALSILGPALTASPALAIGVGTAVTYQGELQKNGAAVTTKTDLRFTLFDAASAGHSVGGVVTKRNVVVTGGRFSTVLDFGINPYTNQQALWLRIEVRNPAGSGAYTVLGGRQRLTATPFALATRGVNVDAAGNVGIGTATPGDHLHLLASTDNFLKLETTNAASRAGVKFSKANAADWRLFTQPVDGAGELVLDYQSVPVAKFTDSYDFALVGTGPHSLRLQNGDNQVAEIAIAAANGDYSTSAVANDTIIRNMNNGGGAIHLQSGSGAAALTVSALNRVGIGTNMPLAMLHSAGTTRVDGSLLFNTQSYNGMTGSNMKLYRFGGPTGNSTNLYLDMTSAATSLFVIQSNGSDKFWFDSNGTAYKPGGGTWAVLSDERTKNEITPLTGTLDRLLMLHGHSYTYKPEYVESGRALPGTQIGLVAQEVERVFPDWVTCNTADGLKVVTERSTTALMVESLRDLRSEKDAQIAGLKAENADLKARLDRIEALLAKEAAR